MTKCKNHPEKHAVVRGMCQACYMRERRAGQKLPGAYTHVRTPTGATVAHLLKYWNPDIDHKFRGRIDAGGGPDACHVWMSTKTAGGYGAITLAGHNVLAHRMMHALTTGKTDDAVVMHTCDNPSCVNPKHLRGGTHQDNSDDKMSKGRGATSERLGQHLRDRTKHPAAKRVQTPYGIFPSAALASVAVGKTSRTVARYCQTGEGGWTYLD
jgi:hypothetical protein